MSVEGLSAPGGSQYSSNTLKVGDGTWDSSRDSFLLPNLVGLNLATTQYNGMGNRFRELLPYHSLIKAHGSIATIVFLLLIPTAILVARFYQRNRRRAIWIHVWIQILVVFLLTVVLILGWFAVGPNRSLSNPHHGIGVAIYTLVLVQVIGGAIVRSRERNKSRDYLPVKTMLHHWFGRAIALLGVAQVPLGLALYGAAQVFFILYAFAVAAWVIIYFVLSHRYQAERFLGSDYGSYVSGRQGPRNVSGIGTERENGGNFWRNIAIAGGALAGWRALRNKRDRGVDEEGIEVVRQNTETSRAHSTQESRLRRRPSGSFVEEEKYSNIDNGRSRSWRDRLVGAGFGLAAVEGVRRLMSRRTTVPETHVTDYERPPLGDNSSISHADISRVHAGHAPHSPGDARRSRRVRASTVDSALSSPSHARPTRSERISTSQHESVLTSPSRLAPQGRESRLRPRRSESFSSMSSRDSVGRFTAVPPTAGGWSTRDGIAATIAGWTGYTFLRRKQQERRDRREERRTEQLRRYDEEIADRLDKTQKRRADHAGTAVDGTVGGLSPVGHGRLSQMSLNETTALPLPALATTQHGVTEDVFSDAGVRRPGYPVDTSAVPIPTGPGPAPGAHFTEANTSRVRFQDDIHSTAAGSTAVPPTTQQLFSDKRSRPLPVGNQSATSTDISSGRVAPIAVKVKLHDDNEHVTLRRLNPAEVAAEREKRRRERRTRNRPRRGSSLASDSEAGGAANSGRPVRASATAPFQPVPAPPMSVTSTTHPGHVSSRGHPLPPPPPNPAPPPIGVYFDGPKYVDPRPGLPTASPPMLGGGYTSTTGTGTEMSAFDEARRRRRAERAAAKQRALDADTRSPVNQVGIGSGDRRGDYD